MDIKSKTKTNTVTNKKVLLFLILFSIIFVSGCTSKKTNFLEYNDPLFTIKYPSTWEQTQHPSFRIIFSAPAENEFSANLGISLIPVQESVTIEEVAKAAKDAETELLSQYEIISEGYVTVNGKNTFKRTFSWYNDKNDLYVTQVQLILKDDSTLYTLTASSLTSNFQDYEPIFNEMFDSFELK